MVGFYLKRPGVLAFGLASKSRPGFIVCAGSNIRNIQAGNMSVYRKSAYELRRKLLRTGVISSGLVFLTAYEFKNISAASSVILGQSRSGDGWFNSAGESYPEWSNPTRKRLKIMFKKGSRFITNSNEIFLVRDVVTNRDDDNKEIVEYLLRPNYGTKRDEFLIPEIELIKALKTIIKKDTVGVI